jgi:hypothetical protein
MNVGLGQGWNFMLNTVGNWTGMSATIYEDDTLSSRTGTVTPFNGFNNARIFLFPYDNGSQFRDTQFRWHAFEANFPTGVGLLQFSIWYLNGLHAWQMRFEPKIPKTEDKILRITIRQSWSRL